MSLSMEERLQRRKLDALKRGVHRVTGGESLPVAAHVVGVGKAGVDVIAETLRQMQPGAPKFTALAIDIGDQDLGELRTLAATIPAERAEVSILSLEVPRRKDLLGVLAQYRDFLRLEYPRYSWNPTYQPWLPEAAELPARGPFRRAVAKAIYGAAYYGGARRLERAVRAFAAGVDASQAQAMVAVVFGIAGGTGSGIAVDLARHLSNVVFGRRVLVAGIGIAPSDGDPAEQTGGHLLPALNELDCFGDEDKNRGIVMGCGELFRNPFTAGFLMVPQNHVWLQTRDLAATHRRVDREIASLLTRRGGVDLWELLRLLNWVAAPSTQHSAARTPWGAKWIHMLGFADTDGPVAIGTDLPASLGLLADYVPEFVEMRVPDPVDADVAVLADAVQRAFLPDVPPQIVAGAPAGSVQFILPRISKTSLAVYAAASAGYDHEAPEVRLLDHALLLEQGVLLCEPSTRLTGMAGASLWDGTGWIAVPLADLRIDPPATNIVEIRHAT